MGTKSNKNAINIATWNSTGIISSASYLCDMLIKSDVDICGVSEHWLFKQNLHFLDCINSDYVSYAVSDPDLDTCSNRRVGKGGIALLWHKRMTQFVTILETNVKHFIGIQIVLNPGEYIFLFQVYLPCKNHSMNIYRNCLEDLENIICMYEDKGSLIIIGDYNTELASERLTTSFNIDSRGTLLLELLNKYSLKPINTLNICRGAKYSNVPYNTSRETLIDHAVISDRILSNILDCQILEDSALNVSTHRPIIFSLSIRTSYCPKTRVISPNIINWHNVKQEHIDQYMHFLEYSDVLSCALDFPVKHTSDIDDLYSGIIVIVNLATKLFIPKVKFKSYIKPYWNDLLTSLHKEMVIKRTEWIKHHRPTNDDSVYFKQYKVDKRKFRSAHRLAVLTYLKEQDAQIDTAAECDNNEFWRLINKRRNKTIDNKGFEMCFGGTTYNNPHDINYEWGKYFSDLYSPSVDPSFSEEHKQYVENELSMIKSIVSPQTSNNHVVTVEMVQAALRSCKQGKASGNDDICYENVIYGGSLLIKVITQLFNYMITYSHTPPEMKKGVIVTLYKGGNKKKTDPNSYRAISLCSVILKLYEKVLLSFIEHDKKVTFNASQGGFQKKVSCLMTSFMLRECINYGKEHHSPIYACFLDARQAFDRTWISSLLVKLYKTGLHVMLFKAIMSFFGNCLSCVKSNGYTSDWFPILQGTRQGQCMSPLLYLVFINELMNEIESNPYCFRIGDLRCGCPTSADDMVVLSNVKHGLDALINLCYTNSKRERYLYNATKCNTVVFNDTMSTERSWKMGDETIHETNSYLHLGVQCNKHLDLSENIATSCDRLRKSFFSIVDCGIYRNGLHPVTCKKIYESIVLPKALYGSELWNGVTDTQLLPLRKLHRQCIKRIQSIPTSTRTDIALSCLGIYPIVQLIDKRKLLLFGQLCQLDTKFKIKDVLVHRITSFISFPKIAKGFVPDIYRILGKYNLTQFFLNYLHDGIFPSVGVWKYKVKLAVKNQVVFDWNNRLLCDASLNTFSLVQSEYETCNLWNFCREYTYLQPHCTSAFILMCRFFSHKYDTQCMKCNLVTDEVSKHILLFCPFNDKWRTTLWIKLSKSLGASTFKSFCALSPDLQLVEMFRGFTTFQLTDDQRVASFKVFLQSVYYMNLL